MSVVPAHQNECLLESAGLIPLVGEGKAQRPGLNGGGRRVQVSG